ncbi:serine protein kinase [Aspergillus filifer]
MPGFLYQRTPHACIELINLRKMRRFERIHDVVEPVEEYRAGGYHPVHLGDTFNHRYRIVGKWAFGQSSTVWIAQDTRLERYVTLKILKAIASSNSRERSHPGKKHVLRLLDQFEHEGPNGSHLCLVFSVMMSDGQAMTIREKPRYSGYVREISKQILLGLNLQPANILFTLGSDLSDRMIAEPEFSAVHWLPGVKIDNSAPRYLISSQRPRGMLDNADFSTLLVKIGDMGGAMWNTQNDSLPVTPMALRAPELLQPTSSSWNEKVDIWALGCLPIFPIESFGCTADEVREILQSRMHELFEHGSQAFAFDLGERLPTDFGKENSEKLADFLWSALQECPEDREPASGLLNHPFLVG